MVACFVMWHLMLSNMKAIANYNSIKDLIIWKTESLLLTCTAFPEQNCRAFNSFPPLAKKEPFKHGLARKTTEILTVEFLLLQMLTVGLLVFQHLLPDSLSLFLSLSLHISLVQQINDCPRQVRYYWVHVMPKASHWLLRNFAELSPFSKIRTCEENIL